MIADIARTLHTTRLTLRQFRAEDAAPYADLYASAGARFIGGPLGPKEAWEKLAGVIGHWTLRGFGLWALELKEDGRFAGLCGLVHHYDRAGPELGWALLPAFEHRGLMLEGCRRVIAHLFVDCDWPAITAAIAADNTASIALAGRLGFVRDGETSDREPDIPRWRLDNPDLNRTTH